MYRYLTILIFLVWLPIVGKSQIKNIHEDSILCNDGKLRRYFYYIPQSILKTDTANLVVYLHGAVNSPMLQGVINAYPLHSSYLSILEKTKSIGLFPAGDYNANWWSDTGIQNVLNQIGRIKKQYTINPNKIFMSGFSDGGSGTYFFALTNPQYFAGFIPVCGHMAVAQQQSNETVSFMNLNNSPIYILNGGKDQIYPSEAIEPIIHYLNANGLHLDFKNYPEMDHRTIIIEQDSEHIINFIQSHKRNPFPDSIYWESTGDSFNKYLWLSIDYIDNNKSPALWHNNLNPRVKNPHVFLGILTDNSYRGSGVRVLSPTPKSENTSSINFQPSDVIVQIDNMPIYTNRDLTIAKHAKQAGDSVKVKVLRNGMEVTLTGRFPEAREKPLLLNQQPTGAIRAYYSKNTFTVYTSKVKQFSIYIHPEMANLLEPIRIYVNDEKLFEELVKPSKSTLRRMRRAHHDPYMEYVQQIAVEVK